MNASPRTVSPLRQRMIEDMWMRKMQDRTQEAYIRGVRRLARFLGRSPDTATAEDLRRFQLHLVEAPTLRKETSRIHNPLHEFCPSDSRSTYHRWSGRR